MFTIKIFWRSRKTVQVGLPMLSVELQAVCTLSAVYLGIFFKETRIFDMDTLDFLVDFPITLRSGSMYCTLLIFV